MTLTYAALYDILKSKLDITAPDEDRQFTQIHSILPWSGENLDPGILYLVSSPEEIQGPNVLIISPRPHKQWHVIANTDHIPATVSLILQTMQDFLLWNTQCILAAEVEHDIHKLLDLGETMMDLRSMLFGREYKICGYSKSWLLGFTAISYPSAQDIEDFYTNNPDFDITFQMRGMHRYPNYPVPGHMLYHQNLFYQKFYLGRLLLTVPDATDGDGSLMLAQAFCDLVEQCFQYHYLHDNANTSNEMLLLCKKMITDQPYDRELLNKYLQQFGWAEEQHYQMICLAPNGYFHSEETIKYYATQFEQLFSACIALQIGSNLYCIHNLDMERDSDFQQSLAAFMRENLFCAGFSNSYPDFFDGYRYRLQSEDALRFGQQRNPSLWRFLFSDYVSEYALAQCMRQYPARDLCPTNLRTLLEYDKRHPNNDLVKTLYHYYHCQFNAQAAADMLFIHRTTFFYRLRKIQRIAPFHPEDPIETRQFLLAFAALQRESNG